MITELFAVEVNLIEERTSATSKCPQPSASADNTDVRV